jgi:hypothetical protein
MIDVKKSRFQKHCEKLLTTFLNIAIWQPTLLGSVYGKENYHSIFEWLVVVEPHGEVCPPLIFIIN